MPSSSTPEDAAAERLAGKAAFHLRMRARGIRDLDVLRAFEQVPRATFAPPHLAALAMRDLPVPIDCGQTMVEPSSLALTVEALGVGRGHRVLEVGSGSGYATAILAALAEDVIGTERYQRLAWDAQARLEALGLANSAVVWADGLAVPREIGPFDRILAHGILADIAPLMERLTPQGRLVCARSFPAGATIVRFDRDGGDVVATSLHPCRLQPLVPGTAAIL